MEIKGSMIILVVLVILVGGGYYFLTVSAKSNDLCVTCHSMEPFKASIDKTEHGKFNCHACHPLNYRAIRDVVVYISENPSSEEIKKRANVKLFSQCLFCHETKSELHSEHNEEFVPCNKCHYIHEKRDVRDTCTECHKSGYFEGD